jgi:hypothetical protein
MGESRYGQTLGSFPRHTGSPYFENPPAALSPDIDGYLGTNTLHPDMIELNFASHTLRWQ